MSKFSKIGSFSPVLLAMAFVFTVPAWCDAHGGLSCECVHATCLPFSSSNCHPRYFIPRTRGCGVGEPHFQEGILGEDIVSLGIPGFDPVGFEYLGQIPNNSQILNSGAAL